MILPMIVGFVIGRVVSRKSLVLTTALLIGAGVGLIASYMFIPLLYPIFAGDAGLVVGPEFHSIGIMILTENFVIYKEAVYMMTRSYVIDLVFIMTGGIFSVVGAWEGTRNNLVHLEGKNESIWSFNK
ncbi:MAG: hypothetical protein ACFFF9_08500 [Candidatus Thorarchaeota archaeon]